MSDELKNRAYHEGMKLKNSGHDKDVIYARLEKQGISAELAMQVANDIMIERQRDVAKQEEPFKNIAILKIVLGVAVTLVVAITSPGIYVIPVGLIAGGVIYLALKK